MVGVATIVERIEERCKDASSMFKLKSAINEIIQQEEPSIREADALVKTDRLYDDIRNKLKNVEEARKRNGELLVYEVSNEFIVPQNTDEISTIENHIKAFDNDDWQSKDRRNRNFEYFVGAFFLSMGSSNVKITSFHNDGGYDISGEFPIGNEHRILTQIPFRVEARNKNNNVSIEEIEAIEGNISNGEYGFFVSRTEEYSRSQKDRAGPSTRLVTRRQIIAAANDCQDLNDLLRNLVPPDPFQIPMDELQIDSLESANEVNQ